MKNNRTWYIDQQVIPPFIIEKLIRSVKQSNSSLILFNMEQDPTCPNFPSDKFIPYGSSHLIKHCLKNNSSNCYLFMDDTNFSTKEWVKKLGQRMLNHDAKYCQLKDVFSLALPESIFIKPDSDLKSFTGSVVKKDGLERFYNKVKNQEFNFDLSIPVVINSSKNTGWEWRLVMIKDQVIASSSYKLKNMLNLSKKVPLEVFNYAIEAAKIWHPHDIYVMDIGESDNGLKIVEFNCFNASGLYNCDINEIVNKVNEYVDND